MSDPTALYQLAANTKQSDVLLYLGPISRYGYDAVTDLLEKLTSRSEQVYFFLGTYGGDPAAAYRIARALKHHYKKISIVIPTFCKSAGTLLAVGADELLIADTGELGPLDIQLKKTDELFGTSSGLDITQAITFLNKQTNEILNQTLVELNGRYSISTKTAADIATKLATSALSPIYAQIDPVRVGEINRALNIAFQYGKRLNAASSSLKDGEQTLKKLMMEYPDHGFVIDRKEAKELFNHVSAPEDALLLASNSTYEYRKILDLPNPLVDIFQPKEENYEQSDAEEDTNEAEVGAHPAID